MIDPLLLRSWDISLSRERPDIVIAGSPERTDLRMVIEDRQGDLFIVEAVSPGLCLRKRRIAGVLEHLRASGVMEVVPYRRHSTGEFLYSYKDRFWQVVPYVPGVPLDRPGYVLDLWRGEAAAELLLRVRQAAPTLDEPLFDLPRYIDHLVSAIRRNRPELLPKIDEMVRYVRERLYPVYDQLPGCFSHGDYHSINIIWKEAGIAAVIDWEFCGLKPELYDAANMVSCLGIEDPECLWSGAPVTFMERLRASGKISPISFKYFPVLMIALRFAWLSEWLRKGDEEMVRMEFDYFDVLTSLAGA